MPWIRWWCRMKAQYILFLFFRTSPPGSCKGGQRICLVGTGGREERARGPAVRVDGDKQCQEKERRELVTAGSRRSCPGARDEFGNSKQPRWFLRSPSSALPLLPVLTQSHFSAFLPPDNTTSPAVFPKFPPKHSPSRYIQWTLPVLLCPSKLNSSRVVGRGTYPESNVGKITLKTQARSPLLAFSSLEGSSAVLSWGGTRMAALLGLRRKILAPRTWEDWHSPSRAAVRRIIHMTQPLRNQHWKHVSNYQFYAEVPMVI